jgi:hypothetical protein
LTTLLQAAFIATLKAAGQLDYFTTAVSKETRLNITNTLFFNNFLHLSSIIQTFSSGAISNENCTLLGNHLAFAPLLIESIL